MLAPSICPFPPSVQSPFYRTNCTYCSGSFCKLISLKLTIISAAPFSLNCIVWTRVLSVSSDTFEIISPTPSNNSSQSSSNNPHELSNNTIKSNLNPCLISYGQISSIGDGAIYNSNY